MKISILARVERSTLRTFGLCMYRHFSEADVAKITDRLNSPQAQEMVTLVVGSSLVKISAHRVLLAYFSQFFEAAFYGALGDTSPSYSLPEADATSVQSFVNWIYSGQYHCDLLELCLDEHLYPVNEYEGLNKREELMAKAWITGDMLIAPEFCNDITHTIFTWLHTVPPYASTLQLFFPHKAPDSLLWQLFMDIIAVRGPFESKPSQESQYAMMDLFKRGGELAVEIVHLFLFKADNKTSKNPCDRENHGVYMQKEDKPSAKEWMRKRSP